MNSSFTSFREKIKSYDAGDQKRILKAAAWVKEHEGDTEKDSGQAYPVRPLELASILMDLNLDDDTIIAAILHAAPEYGASTEALVELFGRDTMLLAEGAARISDISAKNKTIHEAENIRKMLFAMVNDIRVILIRLADKLHTMRTLDSREPKERKAIAQECLDIYAPLADRLGISWMKDELEDLSLKYLNREVFLQIKEIVALKKEERTGFLDKVRETIIREAAAMEIPIKVESRAKHFYSIYQKMRKRNKTIGDLYDLFGIRILCDGIENCYTLLGLVHRLWKPLDGRFKDYIAMYKDNGYQSLHTTVMAFPGKNVPQDQESPEGRLLEIQIRTWEMHHIAEYGIASHWLYKRGSTSELVRPSEIGIVNRLKDWKRIETENGENNSSESFLEDIKREILKDSIYVFTPQGKVIQLPLGATPIDFAYYIHSAIGDHCMGAKADGIIIPLSAELQNTQVVEILTATNAHPHVNWLRTVKTAKARNKIRAWLQENDDSLIIEKNVVAKKKPSGEAAKPAVSGEKETEAAFPGQQFVQSQGPNADILHVRVEDEKNMMIRFAKCCHPVTGDPIIGYVSRGRGIIVHRKNCSNLANIPDFEERKIDTEWENAGSLLIKRFKIEARMSTNLFSEIEGAVRKHQGHLIEGRLEETSANHLTGFFTMQVEQQEDIRRALKNIRGIPGVFSILSLN
jgi:GTP pyrophosphokinase